MPHASPACLSALPWSALPLSLNPALTHPSPLSCPRSNIGDGGNREGLDYRYLPQPAWSLFREPSYGHATLDLLNATHAAWAWHRNQDEASQVRQPRGRGDGRAGRGGGGGACPPRRAWRGRPGNRGQDSEVRSS